MTDDDPRPLKSANGTPEELVRALRALGRDDRDAARLARVGERLGATLAGSSTPTGSWLRSAASSKLGVTGLLLGLGALGALGYSLATQQPAQPARPAPAPSPAAASTAPPVEPPPAAEPPPVSAAAVEPATAVAAAPSPARPAPVALDGTARNGAARAPATRGTTPATRESAAASAAAPATVARTASGTATLDPAAAKRAPEPANANEPEPAAANEPEPAAPEPAPAVAQPAPKPAAAAPRSEVSLLLEARKVAAREPEAALRVLDEHAKRFPNGLLVPERELLAIEVLRKLGRNAEADRRLRRFEARYPESLHLRRLEQGARERE